MREERIIGKNLNTFHTLVVGRLPEQEYIVCIVYSFKYEQQKI